MPLTYRKGYKRKTSNLGFRKCCKENGSRTWEGHVPKKAKLKHTNSKSKLRGASKPVARELNRVEVLLHKADIMIDEQISSSPKFISPISTMQVAKSEIKKMGLLDICVEDGYQIWASTHGVSYWRRWGIMAWNQEWKQKMKSSTFRIAIDILDKPEICIQFAGRRDGMKCLQTGSKTATGIKPFNIPKLKTTGRCDISTRMLTLQLNNMTEREADELLHWISENSNIQIFPSDVSEDKPGFINLVCVKRQHEKILKIESILNFSSIFTGKSSSVIKVMNPKAKHPPVCWNESKVAAQMRRLTKSYIQNTVLIEADLYDELPASWKKS